MYLCFAKMTIVVKRKVTTKQRKSKKTEKTLTIKDSLLILMNVSRMISFIRSRQFIDCFCRANNDVWSDDWQILSNTWCKWKKIKLVKNLKLFNASDFFYVCMLFFFIDFPRTTLPMTVVSNSTMKSCQK